VSLQHIPSPSCMPTHSRGEGKLLRIWIGKGNGLSVKRNSTSSHLETSHELRRIVTLAPARDKLVRSPNTFKHLVRDSIFTWQDSKLQRAYSNRLPCHSQLGVFLGLAMTRGIATKFSAKQEVHVVASSGLQ